MKTITITRERAAELAEIYRQETGHEFSMGDALYFAEMLVAYVWTLHLVKEVIIEA